MRSPSIGGGIPPIHYVIVEDVSDRADSTCEGIDNACRPEILIAQHLAADGGGKNRWYTRNEANGQEIRKFHIGQANEIGEYVLGRAGNEKHPKDYSFELFLAVNKTELLDFFTRDKSFYQRNSNFLHQQKN